MSVGGRPQLHFREKSERSKRWAAAELSTVCSNETNLLVRAATISERKQGQTDSGSSKENTKKANEAK